ncbi:helix-turn-helix domain-containing protein [Streptomyces venezuelae]|uniref:Transcriptional regulator n=1 Tax=Streptomyces venezuelae TaxID=54571 RepID=A0A5P2BLV6_STRVZ|nr:helix-turn-helix transcriptional regulator [Streptomyces venezuelae]QES31107.1 transcriptional regulator [Streptomyces venezuelae]
MSDFDAIDALLAVSGPEAQLPPAEERRALREALNLSQAQVARAIGVSPTTVGGWESGREPTGAVREKYAYFLESARTKLDPQPQPQPQPQAEPKPVVASEPPPGPPSAPEPVSEPCVLCGEPATEQLEGFTQHLDPAKCGTTAASQAPAATSAPPAPAPASTPTPTPARTPVKLVRTGRRATTAAAEGPNTPDAISRAVQDALAAHEGDLEAATAALVKRAIPDAMALLDETRKGGRYDIVAHPWIPDILRKQTSRGPDQIWEARPKWTRAELPPGAHEVTALDINGAYLSALKTHLPIGQLEHSTGFGHDRRRAGVHLVTPPAWEHEGVLPNPIGNRDEPGPLWITEPTLRLLLRLSSPKYGLCDPPTIHESYTSGATEGLLEKFRIALKDARDRAIGEDDEVTLEYVKAMYSKFVATMGESNYNRELYRPDWMHLIRSQAFSNLWMKAYKAYDEGLTVVRAMGTDELHVIGDWQSVFPEGRSVAEVKVKDRYTVGRD